jgi:hypothetical protein
MIRRALGFIIYMAAVGAAFGQTAIRPDQVSPKTPDVTWGPGGTGYQIGSTVAWRTYTGTAPTFTSADAATTVELTNASTSIAGSLPDTTVGGNNLGDGFGFTIQVASGKLVLSKTGTTNLINGLASISVGPYQTVALAVRSNQWYASISAPVTTGAAPPVIARVQDQKASNGTASVASLDVILPGTATGSLFVVALTGYAGAGLTSATTVTATSPATCTHPTGAFVQVTGAGFTDIWYCYGNAAGSVTFHATYTSTGNVGGANKIDYPNLFAAEFSGANTSGAYATGTAAGQAFSGAATYSISTAASVTQTNDLVVSVGVPSTAAPTSIGGNQLAFVNEPTFGWSYQLVNAAGVVNHTYNFAAGQNGTASIAAFTHP